MIYDVHCETSVFILDHHSNLWEHWKSTHLCLLYIYGPGHFPSCCSCFTEYIENYRNWDLYQQDTTWYKYMYDKVMELQMWQTDFAMIAFITAILHACWNTIEQALR